VRLLENSNSHPVMACHLFRNLSLMDLNLICLPNWKKSDTVLRSSKNGIFDAPRN